MERVENAKPSYFEIVGENQRIMLYRQRLYRKDKRVDFIYRKDRY